MNDKQDNLPPAHINVPYLAVQVAELRISSSKIVHESSLVNGFGSVELTARQTQDQR